MKRGSEGRAKAALYNFEQRAATYGSGQMKAVIQPTFAIALEHLEAGRAAAAVMPLVEIALASLNEQMRIIAQKTLPALGADASAPLLAVLAVTSGRRLSVYDSIALQSGGRLLEETTSENMAAFLAGEALEEFTDTETAFAVTSAAITWQLEPQARVARVASRMSSHVALPPLVWFALNLPSPSQRRSAGAWSWDRCR